MGVKKNPEDWKTIKVDINMWTYTNRLAAFAKDNGMSIRAAIRFIINQFFKDKPLY
jgi:hypothetical protein